MNKPVMDQEVLSKKLEPTLLQPDNHNKKYESLFNEIDTGQIKFPASSKPVLIRNRLRSCWVKACASIFSPPAYRIRSKVCKQPALP